MVEMYAPGAKELSDAEADNILRSEKEFDVRMPLKIHPGFSRAFKMNSEATKERLVFDMRLAFEPKKFMFQLRVVDHDEGVLSRLDTWGAAHPNPDGKRVPTPHLHLYKKGFADGIAYPINPLEFRDIGDILKTYDDFFLSL